MVDYLISLSTSPLRNFRLIWTKDPGSSHDVMGPSTRRCREVSPKPKAMMATWSFIDPHTSKVQVKNEIDLLM